MFALQQTLQTEPETKKKYGKNQLVGEKFFAHSAAIVAKCDVHDFEFVAI